MSEKPYKVGDEVVVNVPGGRWRTSHHPVGKVSKVAIKYCTVEYELYSRQQSVEIDMSNGRERASGSGSSTWIETLARHELRMVKEQAVIVVEKHGFQIRSYYSEDRPYDDDIIAVAELLRKRHPDAQLA